MPEYQEKPALFDFIRQIAAAAQSGYLTILSADINRSVLLGFVDGKITSIKARSTDIGDAIDVLNNSKKVKFSFTQTDSVSKRIQIIAVDAFLSMLLLPEEPDVSSLDFNPASSEMLLSEAQSSLNSQHFSSIRNVITGILQKYAGPATEILIEDALKVSDSIPELINQIANAIPDAQSAEAFRRECLGHLPEL